MVLERTGPTTLGFQKVVVADQASLAEMVGALAPLHAIALHGLDRFDPFRRIRPRLDRSPPAVIALVKTLAARDAALRWQAAVVIHGDFHPGQVLRDGDGAVWLVDLDDLARAPAEADLGNLAAWLATQAPGGLDEQAARGQRQVLAHAPWADPLLVHHFCRIALVRRALKLAERGQGWALEQLALWT